MNDLRPTFFIPGFPKCGTTALDLELRQHPHILMAEPKEPELYTGHHGDLNYLKSCYSHGTGGETAIGDATVYYVAHHEVPGRIAADIPDARFVFCLRDPIERALSHYDFRVQRGYEARSWSEVMRMGADADVLRMSCYYSCVVPYYELFDASRFLFVHADELRNPAAVRAVHSFVGVDPREAEPVTANVGLRQRSGSINGVVRAGHLIGLNRRIPTPLKERLRPAMAAIHRHGRSTGRTQPTADQKQRLRELFEPEMAAFRKLTGVGLPGW